MTLTTKKAPATRLLRFIRNKQYEGRLYGPDYNTDPVIVTERWARQFLRSGRGGSAVEVTEPDDDAPPAFDYASAAARELAEGAGLEPGHFVGVEPSGKDGYTKADVQAVIDSLAE